MISLLELALLAGGGYYVSLWINPWSRYWYCRGQGSFGSWLFPWAHRDCRVCKNRKRYPRWGVRTFMPKRAARITALGTDRRRR